MSVSVCGLWTQSAESSVWDQSWLRTPLDNAGKNLGMTILHVVEGKHYDHIAIQSHVGEKIVKFWMLAHLYMKDCLCFPAEISPAVWKFLCKNKRKSHEELQQCISHVTDHYINRCAVPCIGCQAAKHMCEGGQSKRTSLLHQERVFIRCLFCIVLECHTLPPQPVKLTLLKLVPHWEHTWEI